MKAKNAGKKLIFLVHIITTVSPTFKPTLKKWELKLIAKAMTKQAVSTKLHAIFYRSQN
mgnify:CR=1 FL=1